MVQDVRKICNYKIGSIGDMEIRGAYNRLCENGVLKEEYKIVEKKGLTRALDFPNVFKTESIQIVLSKVDDGSLWMDNGPIKINKKIIHRVIDYPTLDQPKTLRRDSKEMIEKNTGAFWNKTCITIDTIIDPLINFSIRIISHKFYQLSRLNSVPCIVVDVGYKIVKKDYTCDLVELQLQQLMQNLGAIKNLRVHSENLVQF